MKTKAQKQEIVQQFVKQVDHKTSLIFVDLQGLKVKDLLGLRKQLKQLGSKLQVVKKTLFQRALKEKHIEIDVKKLTGEVAVIFANEDPIPATKAAYSLEKANEHFKVLGGYLDRAMLDAIVLKQIANLPSKQELLGMLVQTIAAPLSGFMNVLQGNTKGLVVALNAIANKK